MKFVVTFESPKGTQIIEHMGQPGLDILDILRDKFPDLIRLSLDKITIDSSCPLNRNQCHIELNEEQARETGLFKGKKEINVKVPEFFFTQFVDWAKTPRMDTPKGLFKKLKKPTIVSMKLSQVLNTRHIFDGWHLLGFPLNWGIPKKIVKQISDKNV